MSDHDRIHELYAQAAELPPEERVGFLRRELGEGSLSLDAPTEGHVSPSAPVPSNGPGRVGNYHLLQKLGEGGFGDVYLAQQTQPVRRRVAVKVLKPGMDSKAILARFEAERQALALMDHSNIARVFDAGVNEQGRPYFAMEYIQGVSITDHCERHRLSIRDRLQLIRQVCDGLHHAHQKAIIHRDIKPSNILVTLQDGRSTPKIIDFGVAKALSQPLTEDTIFTSLGQLIGTPAYMSPEQAERTAQDIDIRTDVYSLGAVLYELLAGSPPFDPRELQRAGLHGIQRLLREQEPPRPSTRVSSLGEGQTGPSIGPSARTETRRLSGVLRRELDWVTMKALEKDRSRRYGSLVELSADIERYLRHEPVTARPASSAYRFRKFLRRNRTWAVATGSTFILVLAFGVTMSVQAQRIAAEERRANMEAHSAREVSQFLLGMFELADPSEQRGRTITANEILDRGRDRIRGELRENPTVRGRLLGTIGCVYRNLGLFESADSLLQESLETLSTELGTEHIETAHAQIEMGRIDHALGRVVRSRDNYERGIRTLEAAGDSERPDLARALSSFGATLRAEGSFDLALETFGRSLRLKELSVGNRDPEIAVTLNNMAGVHLELGQYDDALDLYSRALALKEDLLGANHPQIARGLTNLAMVHRDLSQYDQSQALLERALEIQEKTLGPTHPDRATAAQTLADLLRMRGEYSAAREMYERALAGFEAAYGNEHPRVGGAASDLGVFMKEIGDYDRARAYHERALDVRTQALGPNHPDVGKSLNNLASVASRVGDLEEAGRLYEKALTNFRAAYGEGHAYVGVLLNNLGDVHRKSGEYDTARSFYEEASRVLTASLGSDHPNLVFLTHNFAILDRDRGDYDAAETGFVEADRRAREAWGAANVFLADNAEEHARLLRILERDGEADSLELFASRLRTRASQ